MNGNNDSSATGKQKNLVDTTDCLEAVGVFRAWKNGLFIIVIICLLLLQVSFWLVSLGYVKPEGCKSESSSVAATDSSATGTEQVSQAAKQAAEQKGKIDKAAKEVAVGSEKPTEAAQQPQEQRVCPWLFVLKFKWLAGVIRFLNFVVILSAVLYCLTMLFSLKVSLVGRLGGINHIGRAFFLSLAFVVFLLPWRLVFPVVVFGVMYTPRELLNSCTAVRGADIFDVASHYVRFSGWWFVALLFLIFAQLRSSRWAKAILRRLEVI